MLKVRNPDEVDLDEEENDQLVPTFTADGIVYFDVEGEFTTWPSTGTMLLLRAMGHILPPTGSRHSHHTNTSFPWTNISPMSCVFNR